jgi:hypothetical protein
VHVIRYPVAIGKCDRAASFRMGSFGRGCRARTSLPATSGLKFLTEAHEAGTGAKGSRWFCAVSRMEWLHARPRVQKSFSRYRLCQQALTDEKAPLFGLGGDCGDNNPAF